MTAPVTEPSAPPAEPSTEPTVEFDFSSIQLEEESDDAVIAPKPSSESKSKSESGKKSASKTPLPRYTEGKYVKPVMMFYGFLATGIGMTGDETCATAVMENGEAIAIQWDRLAKENHAVRRMLEALTQGGAWAGLAIAHLPLLAAMAEHHGKLPEGIAPLLRTAVVGNGDTDDDDN